MVGRGAPRRPGACSSRSALGVIGLFVALAAGLVASVVVWVVVERIVDQPVFTRRNVFDVDVPAAGGIVIVLATVIVAAAHAVARAGLLVTDADGARSLDRTLLAVVGFGFLGLVDDLAGPGDATAGDVRGLLGHLRTVTRGHVSTGIVKLVGGLLVAAVAVAPLARDGVDALARDALLVAAAANLANLFDRAPGRTLKVGTLALVPLWATAATPALLAGPVAVAGAGLGLLVPDLRERVMLGDSGANAYGAALGVGVVISTSPTTRLVVLAVLVALTLTSERVSFSRVIARTAPLRFLDRMGGR